LNKATSRYTLRNCLKNPDSRIDYRMIHSLGCQINVFNQAHTEQRTRLSSEKV